MCLDLSQGAIIFETPLMKKILVIDDVETNLMLVKIILEKSHSDYEILITTSGQTGIEIAQSELPEAILLDVFMPEMDGYEVCRRIKSMESTSSIPVLMISAGGESPETRIAGLRAGADAILSKPFVHEEFVALVNVMLRIKKDEDELKKQNRELQDNVTKITEYQTKLKKMNSELSIAEEKERRRISEYLHDGVSQILSLVNLKLTYLLENEQLPKTEITIRESVELINKAVVETSSLTYDLSPPILYEMGLIPAIKWNLDQIEKKHGISTSIICPDDHLGINNDTRILMYRIISELLNNVVKHAHADLIKIEVLKLPNKLHIAVIDNGLGFAGKELSVFTDKGGFGLFSIRERLDSIQGSLYFDPEQGMGTKAVVRIPL